MLKKLLSSTKTMLIICLGLLSVFSYADEWDRIAKNKKIIIGLDDTFVPMGFRDKDNQIVGFDVDLAKAVFDKYGIEVQFQPITWSMKETELNNKLIDLIWNGYSVTNERKEKVLFSHPYIENRQVLVALKSSNINSFADMKDKALAVQLGSTGEELLESQPEILLNLIDKDKLVKLESFNLAFIDLNSQRIDGIVVDKIYGRYYIDRQSNKEDFKIVEEKAVEPENIAVGMRKTDAMLKEKIDQALKDLYKEGKLQKISEKWFGKDIIIPQN